MLVLTRRVGERILIGNDIWVTVTSTQGGQVKIGFDVPDDVHVIREELIGTKPKGRTHPSAPKRETPTHHTGT